MFDADRSVPFLRLRKAAVWEKETKKEEEENEYKKVGYSNTRISITLAQRSIFNQTFY